jgi:hypothetical protein
MDDKVRNDAEDPDNGGLVDNLRSGQRATTSSRKLASQYC